MEEKGKQHHGDKIRYTSVEKSPTIIQVQCNIAIPLFRLWQNNSISRCAQKTPFIQTISRDICISHINTKVPKNLFPISEEDRSRAGGPQAPINTGTQRDNYQIILNIPDIDLKTHRTNPTTRGREEATLSKEESAEMWFRVDMERGCYRRPGHREEWENGAAEEDSQNHCLGKWGSEFSEFLQPMGLKY